MSAASAARTPRAQPTRRPPRGAASRMPVKQGHARAVAHQPCGRRFLRASVSLARGLGARGELRARGRAGRVSSSRRRAGGAGAGKARPGAVTGLRARGGGGCAGQQPEQQARGGVWRSEERNRSRARARRTAGAAREARALRRWSAGGSEIPRRARRQPTAAAPTPRPGADTPRSGAVASRPLSPARLPPGALRPERACAAARTVGSRRPAAGVSRGRRTSPDGRASGYRRNARRRIRRSRQGSVRALLRARGPRAWNRARQRRRGGGNEVIGTCSASSGARVSAATVGLPAPPS